MHLQDIVRISTIRFLAGLSLISLLAVLPVCDSSTEPDRIYCEHIYKEPILTIRSAKGTTPGSNIDRVYVYNVLLDSVEANIDTLAEQSENIGGWSACLGCTVPCSFGAGPGHYEFLVAAEGHQVQLLSFDAEYSDFEDGCPSYESGPVVLDLELGPIEDYALNIIDGYYELVMPDSHVAVVFDYGAVGTPCNIGGYAIRWYPDVIGIIDWYMLSLLLPGQVYTIADTFEMSFFDQDSVVVTMQGYLPGSRDSDPKLSSYYTLERKD